MTAEDRSGRVFVFVALTVAIIVGVLSISLLMDDEDKTVKASYKLLAKKEKKSSPFPEELTANFRKLSDRWTANGPVKNKDLIELCKTNVITGLQLAYTDISADGLAALVDEPVILLVISGSPVTDKDFAVISKLEPLKRLSIYESTAPPITDETILSLTGPQGLEELALRGSDISEKGLAHIRQTFPNLVRLDLMYVKTINDKAVDEILKMPKLQTLDITHTKVSEKGVIRIAQKKNLVNLQLVGLGITDSTIPVLTANNTINYLGLSYTRITDKGLRTLAKCRSLNQLAMTGCNGTTEAGMERFKRERPDCTVYLQARREKNPLDY